jgi:hypothetical protein
MNETFSLEVLEDILLKELGEISGNINAIVLAIIEYFDYTI